MASPALARDPAWRPEIPGPVRNEAHASGVSWPAVFAGAFVAAALSLILLALGTGLGLSTVSPWSNEGASASAIKASAVIWLIVMEIIAAAMGGYIAGRLRTKWASIHTDEVYFRDTAHGFLVWATATVITAAFLTSAAAGMVGGAARGITAEAASASTRVDPNAYFIDGLLRTAPSASTSESLNPSTASAASALPNGATVRYGANGDAALRGEVGMIFANALRQGSLSASDQAYLAQVVSARTGVSDAEAQHRVSDAFAQIQQAADDARRAVAHTALWVFLALLIGAFCASLAATWGGAQRDHVVEVRA